MFHTEFTANNNIYRAILSLEIIVEESNNSLVEFFYSYSYETFQLLAITINQSPIIKSY